MRTVAEEYERSVDGRSWSQPVPVLLGREGAWDARGARVTAVLPGGARDASAACSADRVEFQTTAELVPARSGRR